MSWEEVTTIFNNIANTILFAVDEFIMFISRFIPISLFLGVILAHLEQAIVKRQSFSSIIISITGSFIVVYFLTPIIQEYLAGSSFFGVAALAIGYFIQYIIKYVTNQERVNKWLLMVEKGVIDRLKNIGKKKS